MKRVSSRALWAFMIIALFALMPAAASAYQIGEDTLPGAAADGTQSDTAGQGPIRLARFSFVQGNVTWRPGDGADWSLASVSLPIRQAAQAVRPQQRCEADAFPGRASVAPAA